ncbi:MAG: Hsp70 family protein [Planctomycetales bacterium]|nr:Hsp70 family protein [Planctomycetales bacterium]
MTAPQPALGIDLGTTNSASAYLDAHGNPQTLSNSEGEPLTPSVLLFEDGDVIVGKEASKAAATDYHRVVDCAKRQLGRRLHDKQIDGQQYPPELLQALTLAKLRRDAEAALGPIRSAVVTVPAYFDEVRRKATQDAAYMAGLELLDIINEPTAAAIAYGHRHQLTNGPPQVVLVYDLGGGTFDVTVMQVGNGEFLTLATDGDVQLGGRDWDQRLVDWASEACLAQFRIDPREDMRMLGRLWRECEDLKHTLSARAKGTLHFDCRGESCRLEITRREFEERTSDLLERTAFTTRQTLDATGLDWSDISQVLLVGGSTRMPAVSEMLRNLTGRTPDRSVSPDEAVAHGAALHAGHLLGGEHLVPFTVRNVNSHSLGVAGADPATKLPRTAVLIPRNTPLPATARGTFKTQKTGQDSILVQIVEGESANPRDCSQLGRCVVRDLPPNLPAKTPVIVEFNYQENGRLQVSVAVGDDAAKVEHELIRENSLTRQQLDHWRAQIAAGTLHRPPADG